MKYPGSRCGTPHVYLLEGKLGPCCYVPHPVGALPKSEKASFTNDINARRAQIRRQKRGGKRRAVITAPRRLDYFRTRNLKKRTEK